MTNTPHRQASILVWDAPVRVFHWLAVLCFFGAFVSGESERWRLAHVTLGYTLGGLVAFRILWGLLGTHYARFSSFVRGPQAVRAYLRALRQGVAPHHTGHNPAGALAIVLLLLLSLLVVVSGWAVYDDWGGKLLEDLHEGSANAMLAVVVVHVLGVLVASWAHRENLVRAMLTGKKTGEPGAASVRRWPALAAVIVLLVVSYWCWQWQTAPLT